MDFYAGIGSDWKDTGQCRANSFKLLVRFDPGCIHERDYDAVHAQQFTAFHQPFEGCQALSPIPPDLHVRAVCP